MLKKNKERSFIKGFKFPIYPTEEQKILLEKTFGCCRFVWNKALTEAKQEYDEYLAIKDINTIGNIIKPIITGFYFANKLSSFKTQIENNFLLDVSYDVLRYTLINLGTAFSEFFKKRKGYPKFKKKKYRQSFYLTKNVFRFKNDLLYIAKSKEPLMIGWGRKGKKRQLPSEPSSCTISKTPTGKYYISFICEYVPEKTCGEGKIGIDLGLKDFLVTSDGIKIPNPKFLFKHERNLKRKQQKLARCQPGSNRRNKARLKIAQIHETIANYRNNFHHQLSRQLINENQVIGIEKLRVKNMMRNRKLSKAIQQVGWSSFVNQLIYKSRESQHCNIVRVDTYYPSTHICNETQQKLDFKLKLNQREFHCPHCGRIHDRDLNAAKNIRDEAICQLIMHQITAGGQLILIERQ